MISKRKILKRTKFLFFILIGGPSLLVAQPLTLNEIYLKMIHQNPDILYSQSKVKQADAEWAKGRALLWPEISFSGSYQRQNTISLSSRATEFGSTKLNLQESFSMGGKDIYQMRSKNKKFEASQFDLYATKITIFRDLARVFYRALSHKHDIANTVKAIELLQKRLLEVERRKAIGKSREIEALSLQSQRSLLEAQLLIAENLQNQDQQDLQALLGQSQTVEISDTDQRPIDGDIFSSQVNSGTLALSELVEQNPQVAALKSELMASEFLVRAAKADHFPSLNLSVNYYPYRFNPSSSAQDWDTSITVSIPLFAGGGTEAEVRARLEGQSQAVLALERVRQNVKMDLERVIKTFRSTLEQLKKLEQAVDAAEKNFRAFEKDYRFSLATNLEVLQALNTLHEAHVTKERTRYLLLTAAAELKALTHTLPSE